MIFAHSSLIQEGEAVLFYRFNRALNGYMVAGLYIAPDMVSKMNFAKVWKYFVSEIVQADDIYCTISLDVMNSMFKKYIDYHSTVDGIKIYKVDKFLKKKYSSYDKHIASVTKP
jgi:hypothetical protein|tara:strand:+ start:532 stop:873 length:342 start_codon:yes stop_codon:yes gene_type:complete